MGAPRYSSGCVGVLAAWVCAACQDPSVARADRPAPEPVAAAAAQPAPVVDAVRFRNVRVFDGTHGALSAPSDVLVRGNKIERISPAASEGAQLGERTIDGAGRTLMPGLIDAHWHAMMAAVPMQVVLTGDLGYLNVLAAREAADTLQRGFTTVRDLGGPVFGLKQAIDEGLVPGPRIYPSGAMITITGGHGDFRRLDELPRTPMTPLSHAEQIGGSAIADGPDEVRRRVREQLMRGASQVKLTAGGGVASPHSPLDVTTFTEAELRAAVEAAASWGTYVTVHAYTPASIQRAIAAGVKCIEHGHLMDAETAQLMKAKGIWLSIQPFLDDEDTAQFSPGSDNRKKQLEVISGTDRAYALARKYGLKTVFGTDVLFSKQLADRQGAQLAKLRRWYTPADLLITATGTAGELLRLSGPRDPYPGKLGVVEEGALADLILVDGDPLTDPELLATPDASFLVIMKDGKIYKDRVAGRE
ncbi:MAG: amidohydrolase family protein [Deltaproteobacteria bacterium]|nr:amidohydrolase family protein [Deltaproteobacteria bacterium]